MPPSALPPPQSHHTPHLLTLPTELRLLIYSHLPTTTTHTLLISSAPHASTTATFLLHTSPGLRALHQTCRTTRSETRPLVARLAKLSTSLRVTLAFGPAEDGRSFRSCVRVVRAAAGLVRVAGAVEGVWGDFESAAYGPTEGTRTRLLDLEDEGTDGVEVSRAVMRAVWEGARGARGRVKGVDVLVVGGLLHVGNGAVVIFVETVHAWVKNWRGAVRVWDVPGMEERVGLGLRRGREIYCGVLGERAWEVEWMRGAE